MQQTIATYRSRSSGKVRVHGFLTFNGEWIIDRAFDEDEREVSVPDFETAEAIEELALQALQDAIDAEHERDWLRDCGDTLDAMSDDDLDAFALETEGYLAAAEASR